MKKVYELWFNDTEATLFDEETEEKMRDFLTVDQKLIIKFEAHSLDEAMTKMNAFLNIYHKK